MNDHGGRFGTRPLKTIFIYLFIYLFTYLFIYLFINMYKVITSNA